MTLAWSGLIVFRLGGVDYDLLPHLHQQWPPSSLLISHAGKHMVRKWWERRCSPTDWMEATGEAALRSCWWSPGFGPELISCPVQPAASGTTASDGMISFSHLHATVKSNYTQLIAVMTSDAVLFFICDFIFLFYYWAGLTRVRPFKKKKFSCLDCFFQNAAELLWIGWKEDVSHLFEQRSSLSVFSFLQ